MPCCGLAPVARGLAVHVLRVAVPLHVAPRAVAGDVALVVRAARGELVLIRLAAPAELWKVQRYDVSQRVYPFSNHVLDFPCPALRPRTSPDNAAHDSKQIAGLLAALRNAGGELALVGVALRDLLHSKGSTTGFYMWNQIAQHVYLESTDASWESSKSYGSVPVSYETPIWL